jgi:hypothetical protein
MSTFIQFIRHTRCPRDLIPFAAVIALPRIESPPDILPSPRIARFLIYTFPDVSSFPAVIRLEKLSTFYPSKRVEIIG